MVEVLCFDLVLAPGIEPDRKPSAVETANRQPFLLRNTQKMVGISDVLWVVVDEDKCIGDLALLLGEETGKSAIYAFELV